MDKWYQSKWYQSHWMKTILCFLIVGSLLVCFLCSIQIMNGLNKNITWNDIIHAKSRSYVESESFIHTINDIQNDIVSQLFYKSAFETDGKYDGEKLVDIENYANDGVISGKNISGFAYPLNTLLQWPKEKTDEESPSAFVVCRKPDSSYDYYTYSDFQSLILSEDFHFNQSDQDKKTDQDILNELYSGIPRNNSNNATKTPIKNVSNQMIYTDCWMLFSPYSKIPAPHDAENILDIANNNPNWNGRLSDMLEDLDTSIVNLQTAYSNYKYYYEYSAGNSNIYYLFIDKTNQNVYSNRTEYQDYDKAAQNISLLKKSGAYVLVTPNLKDFETNLDTEASNWMTPISYANGAKMDDYIFVLAVDTNFPVQDILYSNNKAYNEFLPRTLPLLMIGFLAFVVFVISFLWITIVAGRSNHTGHLVLNSFDKIWTELGIAIPLLLWLFVCFFAYEFWDTHNLYISYYTPNTQLGFGTVFFIVCFLIISITLVLIEWLSLVRRFKLGILWRNSILRKICCFCLSVTKHLLKFLQNVWYHKKQTSQVIFITVTLVLLQLYAALRFSENEAILFFIICIELTIAIFIIQQMFIRNEIQKGIQEISKGNMTYQIDTSRMKGNVLTTATLVNNIGNGLHSAIEQSMKDERMKADLIANVSHDIKTPLTSIINYVDLLKRENFSDPKIKEYIDILERKAQRLKTLTEDVVEASKVSSGNVTLEMININFSEMLNQIEGEFIEKFESRNLSIVNSKPSNSIVIPADGKYLSRILDNIYENAFKYTLEGTRIYADLCILDGKAVFSLKNISEHALNISADELTERFIRGDVSRTSEGSGLGLSITKSLTELMGGSFSLYLDGDLFKVTLSFPLVDNIVLES